MSETTRLILAEDDEFLRQLLQTHCEALGAKVAAVSNGEDAVSLALSYEYDVLLMDIQMPVCDGVQAMTLLRQLGYERPIYAMSADPVSADGFTAVLTKPLQEQDVYQLLQQHSYKAPVPLVVAPELLQQFLHSLPRLHTQLSRCHIEQNWQELQRLSHKLKGSAGSFGYPEISAAANRLQQAIEQQQPVTSFAPLVTKLSQLLQEVSYG